jgi:hypothetical protein
MDTCIENIADPAHVPFLHHGLVGNRKTVKELVFQPTERLTPQGFAGTTVMAGIGQPMGVSFAAPTHIKYMCVGRRLHCPVLCAAQLAALCCAVLPQSARMWLRGCVGLKRQLLPLQCALPAPSSAWCPDDARRAAAHASRAAGAGQWGAVWLTNTATTPPHPHTGRYPWFGFVVFATPTKPGWTRQFSRVIVSRSAQPKSPWWRSLLPAEQQPPGHSFWERAWEHAFDRNPVIDGDISLAHTQVRARRRSRRPAHWSCDAAPALGLACLSCAGMTRRLSCAGMTGVLVLCRHDGGACPVPA